MYEKNDLTDNNSLITFYLYQKSDGFLNPSWVHTEVEATKPTKVVVKYLNGKVIKGFMQNFSPNKDSFHLIPADKPSTESIEVAVKNLKAIFVVRDFIGNPQYDERKQYVEGEKPSGLKLEVTFTDGEVIVGSTLLGYDPKRKGNFIIPADPNSNNIRIFAVSSAVKSVRQLFDNPE